MRTRLREQLKPLVSAAADRTRSARSRNAERVFLGQPASRKDQVLSRAHFALFPGTWEGLGRDEHHLRCFATAADALPPPQAGALVVDVGTGAGSAAAILARRWPQARVEGIDVSRRMVRLAARMHAAPNLSFRRATVTALPYTTSTVDVVTCHNAVVSPPEIHRVLAAHGRLVMASTWFPLRDTASPWVKRFEESGFTRTAQGNVDQGSWEIWQPV
jgi:SAM-dependent methyltransferase